MITGIFTGSGLKLVGGKRRNPDGKNTYVEVSGDLQYYPQYPIYELNPENGEQDKLINSWSDFTKSFEPYAVHYELDYFHYADPTVINETLHRFSNNDGFYNSDYDIETTKQYDYFLLVMWMKTPADYVIPIVGFEKITVDGRFEWKVVGGG